MPRGIFESNLNEINGDKDIITLLSTLQSNANPGFFNEYHIMVSLEMQWRLQGHTK